MFRSSKAFTSATVGLLMLCSAVITQPVVGGPIAGEEWSQWRGPSRDGRAPMFEAPESWPQEAQQLWKVEVGEGHGSPVVADGRVYLITRQGDDEVAMALDLKTGKTLWTQRFPTPYTMNAAATGHGKGPKSSPIVAQDVVCFLGIDARLTCHATNSGKTLWTRDFSEHSGHETNFCGSSLSPLVDGGTLYAHLGDDTGGRLFAADLRTGEEKWGWTGQGPSYTSPMLIEVGGAAQLVTLGAVDLLGFDPKDGRLLWRRPFPDEWNQNIVTPLAVGEKIIFADLENGTLAAWPRPVPDTENGTPWTLEELWLDKELTQYMASPVTDGKWWYGFSNRQKGQLFVADPADGKVQWQGEGRGGRNATLTLAGDWLLVSNTDAELRVYRRKGSSLELVRTYEIADSAVWSHPAWVKDGLVIKDSQHLIRWRLAESARAAEKTATAAKASN